MRMFHVKLFIRPPAGDLFCFPQSGCLRGSNKEEPKSGAAGGMSTALYAGFTSPSLLWDGYTR